MQPFAGNYSQNRKFARTDYLCWCQKSKETEHHLITKDCPTYRDIKDRYQNLNSDEELISFFQELLKKRDEQDGETKDTSLVLE